MTENTGQKTIPDDWDADTHDHWEKGKINVAIESIINKINSFKGKKPKGFLVQASYYFFLLKDYKASSLMLKNTHEFYPEDQEVLLNLGVSLSRAKNYSESIEYTKKYLKDDPQKFVGWDSLASCYAHIGDYEKSAKAGNNSLIIKDKLHGVPDASWSLPKKDIKEFVDGKKRVIAFSLWGNQKRYIYGALRNLLLAPDIYPDWELWFYVDNSVSPGFLEIIGQLGGKIFLQPENQSERDKLCWRFKVSNHPEVGYFLVRDIDSVFSIREFQAVQEWLASDKWFHIIRDWWTHTDLILAGLWGGISGVLPDLQKLLDDYQPNSVATPNIDQWFLRDCVWKYVKRSCFIHDRCFKHHNSVPLPGTPNNDFHVGICEHTQRPDFQEKMLSAWIRLGQEQTPTPTPAPMKQPEETLKGTLI